MKRFLLIVLIVLAMMSLLFVAEAAEKKNGLFTYELKGNGTAVITEFDWTENGEEDIYIPRMLDGYTVTGIGNLAFSGYSYTYRKNTVVVLPDTITSIGEKAFFDTGCIATINIPSSVQTIGAGAFSGTGCKVTVDPNNRFFATIDGSLYNKSEKKLIYGYGNTDKYTVNKNNLNVPEGIKSIGAYACYGLDAEYGKVSFPSTLTEIGDYAFYSAKLGECRLPESLISIGNHAFEEAIWSTSVDVLKGEIFINETNRGKLNVLYIPENVDRIGEGAFKNCSSIGDFRNSYDAIVFGYCKIKEIPTEAFYGVNARSKDTVEYFGSSVVCWPKELQVIGEKAFAHTILEITTLPTGITTIKPSAFEYLAYDVYRSTDKERIFTLPEGLEILGEDAFWGCYGLKTLVLPTTLTSIGDTICDRATVSLQVESGTYPAIWASENGYPTTSASGDDTSWLNG